MEVQCEQKGCNETDDMRDMRFCYHCQGYYCQDCYDENHAEHDTQSRKKPNWVLALQR